MIAALSWTLVHSIWQIAALVVVMWLAGPALARWSASARYVAYCAALAAVPVIAALTFASLLGADTSGAFALGDAAGQGGAVSSAIATAAPWLVSGWLLGVAVCAARLIAGCVQVRRLRGSTSALDHPWQAALDRSIARLRTAMRVRAPVTIAESLAVAVPTVVGWLRPVILLPVGLVTRLPPDQLDAIIAHELGHVRRYDALVNLVQSMIDAVFFYHPGVRWLSRHIRVEREYCCDDLAVACAGDPIAYSLALTELESLRTDASPLALNATTATAINPQGGSLMSRIRRLVTPPSHAARSGNWLMPGVLAIAAACIALGSACEVDPEPTGEATVELIEPGTAKFIDDSGTVHDVPAGHTWVEDSNAAVIEEMYGEPHPHHTDKLDLAAHGGVTRFQRFNNRVQLTLKDGTIVEIKHPPGRAHGGHDDAPAAVPAADDAPVFTPKSP